MCINPHAPEKFKVKGKVDGETVRYRLTHENGVFEVYNKTRGHVFAIPEGAFRHITQHSEPFQLTRRLEKEFFNG